MEKPDHGTRLRIGWFVFAALAALTAVEIGISLFFTPAVTYLVLTSLAKAALIVIYFMHVSEVWKAEE